MGVFGSDGEKGPPERKQKWEFITLSDFRSKSVWTGIAYGWLWFMAFVSVAVYAVDTFTAVQLLAFDKWGSQVQPKIPFYVSKWIFAGCIFLSWALCIYEWIRAIRVIKRGGVAASYMDPVAASLQCMRSQGWRRFLVFTELTKSKKGTDYVAFFVYFAFQGAIRVILAEGPRQVVNALTLYSVMQTKLILPKSDNDNSKITQFFLNLQGLANQNYQQAVILGSMLFTLVIWVFSALCLIAAGVLYLVFLWHYIPQQDGRLRIYCRRKVDRRLEKIVEHKVKAAIEEENRRKEKEEKKAELKSQKTGELAPPAPPKLGRQPTLPDLKESTELKSDKLPDMPLHRQDTSTTVSILPQYSSRPPTRQGVQRQPTLPDLGMNSSRPGMPSRTGTQASGYSQASYESDAPLLSNAGYAGNDGRVASPAPTYYSRQNSNASFNQPLPPVRTATQSTQASSQRSFTPMSRMDTNGSQFSHMSRPPPGHREPPLRSNTGFSFDQERQSATSASPITPVDAYGRPLGPPPRQNTADSFRPGPGRQDSQTSYFSRPVAATPGPVIERKPTYGSLHSQSSSFSRPMPRKPSQPSSFNQPFSPASAQGQPTPNVDSYEMTSQPSYGSLNGGPQRQESNSGYVAFNPSAHAPTPVSQLGAQRSVTVAGQPGAAGNCFGQVQEASPRRSVTMPNDFRAISSYGSILDDYGASAPHEEGGPHWRRRFSPPSGPVRAHTAGPSDGRGSGWGNRF